MEKSLGYDYDIFFSYKRHPKTDPWFLALVENLEPWISHELHREASIFIDQEDIKTGAKWRRKISESLKKSRCIVCIWSPLYFESKWCVAEWESFVQRCQLFNCELIVPARYFDGQHYPDLAKDVESRDFSHYTSLSPRFWDSELFLEFEQKHLKDFAGEVADAVKSAPPYSDEFPIVQDPDDRFMIPRTKIGRPADD
ncbi:MAG: toll/interleukin-1 receptor domain-containing protein [Aliishimia sp.]